MAGEMGRGQVDRGLDHGRRIRRLDRRHGIARHHLLDDLLHAVAAERELDLLAAGLLDRLEDTEQHVVVIGPHRVDLWIFGEVVLHQLEGLVAVPVRILDIEHLEPAAGNAVLEALDALVVDHRRDAAQHDEIALAAHLLDQELRGVVADRDVVAGDVEVLDLRIVEAAIDHGDEAALLLDRLHRRRQFLGRMRQDDQRVELAGRGEILDGADLRARRGRGLDDDLNIREGRVDLLGRGIGMIDHAGGPAVVGCGDRDRDRLLLGGRSRTGD